MTTQDRRKQHVALKLAEQRERQRRLAQMTWGRRVDLAFLIASNQSQVAGRLLDAERVSSGKSRGNAPAGGSDPDVDKYVGRILVATQALERVLAAYALRPLTADYYDEDAEDKDKRLIEEFEGYSPEDVMDIDPSFGSKRAVERARVRMERDPYTGGELA